MFTAVTYLRRFYLSTPCIMEHNPEHMLVVCLFLAAKVEERSDATLAEFWPTILNDKDASAYAELATDPSQPATALVTLCREVWFKRKADPNVRYDGLDKLRYLEVELCKTLGFDLLVHNPLSIIHHVRYLLLEFYREQPVILQKLKDPKQYGK